MTKTIPSAIGAVKREGSGALTSNYVIYKWFSSENTSVSKKGLPLVNWNIMLKFPDFLEH